MENCAVLNGAAELVRPGLDRRAMDALMNAVEARMREYGAQIDRRLADLEAGLAIEINSLGQQESARTETALEHAEKQWNEQTLALWQQRKEDLGTLRQEFTDFQRQVTSEIRAAVEREVTARLAAMAETRSKEIAELRQRLVESERNVLEITLGMGEWFRELAARMCSPRPEAPTPPSGP